VHHNKKDLEQIGFDDEKLTFINQERCEGVEARRTPSFHRMLNGKGNRRKTFLGLAEILNGIGIR
jgi:hypothetical protein